MEKKRLSKSTRKFIRKKKAEIRRQLLSFKEQEESIAKLYGQFLKPKDIKS